MSKPFSGWALLEIMGHRQRPGYVQEVEIAGAKMLRVDVPVSKDEAGQDKLVTEFYAMASVYSLRPCSEEVIRGELARYGVDPRPIRPLEYRERDAKQIASHADNDAADEDETF